MPTIYALLDDPLPAGARLDARLLVGAHDVLVGPERRTLPAAAIEIEDPAGLALEVRIAGKIQLR